ncbi:hypothetical protein LCGC14_1238690 [marine sediment metagenome]|uniref:Uncharacterized protein n=1 Tax=marine sediment metagenome TaxID=412755 RepID=A0A0F9L6N4_9ZZZZ|nr:hypothetical protein [Pricia sp.]
MSEKLYTSHCTVGGHGTWCSVAQDKIPSKKELSKLRRQASKKLIADEVIEITKQVLEDYSDAWEQLAKL